MSFIFWIFSLIFTGITTGVVPGVLTATKTFLSLFPTAMKISLFLSVKAFEFIFYPAWSRCANGILQVIAWILGIGD